MKEIKELEPLVVATDIEYEEVSERRRKLRNKHTGLRDELVRVTHEDYDPDKPDEEESDEDDESDDEDEV